jgi:hypothetical protein
MNPVHPQQPYDIIAVGIIAVGSTIVGSVASSVARLVAAIVIIVIVVACIVAVRVIICTLRGIAVGVVV